jgi:four helix bundle protein
MRENILKEKSKAFAIKIVNLYKQLVSEKKEFVLSRQLLRSGTSIGANIREAEFAESKSDFIHKMAISQKETNETIYWMELLVETNFVTMDQFESINNDAIEIIKLLTASIKTAKGIK